MAKPSARLDIARAFAADNSDDDQFIRLLQSFGSDSVVQDVLSQTDLASLHDRIAENARPCNGGPARVGC